MNFFVVFTCLLVLLCLQHKDVANANVIAGSGDGEATDGANANVYVGGGDGEARPSECTPEFEKEAHHTMCLTDDPRVEHTGVSDAEKKIIVDLHNKLRSNLDPPAEDMPKLIWDDKIAAVAQKWAKQCIMGHDKNRAVPSYGIFIGQNAGSGYANWEGVIMGWYNEVKMYKFGEKPEDYLGAGGFKKIGHYTQLVQNSTDRVGCGWSKCAPGTWDKFYICNYGYGQSNAAVPYTKGTLCAKCPNSCKDGLCDCGGRMCLHNGKLDMDTCKCKCTAIYSGDSCETLSCPARDDLSCWREYPFEWCKYGSIKIKCPYMCGICGPPPTGPPTFVSRHGCTYKGERPSKEECSQFGDAGADTWMCASRGGTYYDCKQCDMYYNAKTQYCPEMCGFCDGPCNGLACMNGGKLNRESCTCECKTHYIGERCETYQCPDDDAWYCASNFVVANCTQYSNIPPACPYLCGKCHRPLA